MKPIFMIGTQRSGSNLLRLMLNQLPAIAAPHPPHILQRIMPLVPDYGDLAAPENFSRLVDDICRMVELNPVPWEGVTLDRKDVASRCREKSLVAIHGAVYDIYAEARKAKTWCCKSLANINFVPQIEAYFDKPQYIYLFRDGRDVAVSFRKAVVGEKHFYHIAREWGATQRLALKIGSEIEPSRFLKVRYEDIIGEPEKMANMLCDFFGVAYRKSMLEYHQAEEAKRTASASELWLNVTRPVMKNNSRKFLLEAGERDVRIFESVAGDVLDALGYDRVYVRKGEELRFTDAEIADFNAENARLKEELRKLVDPADLMRRDLQAGLLKEIQARNAGHRPRVAGDGQLLASKKEVQDVSGTANPFKAGQH
ncbi:MAG: sulfotransferase [Nitrospirota bacterium]